MKNKPKEPPRIAVKFANTVFVLGILYSILLVVYAIYKIYNSPELLSPVFYIFCILSCGVFATLFILGLKRLSNNLKVNLSILFFTTGIAVYGFETYLEFSRVEIETQGKVIAKQMGVPYDTRTEMEVLNDQSRAQKCLSLLKEKKFVTGIEKVGEMFSFKICSGKESSAAKVLEILVKNKVVIKSFMPVEVDLEDVFLKVTSQHGNEE